MKADEEESSYPSKAVSVGWCIFKTSKGQIEIGKNIDVFLLHTKMLTVCGVNVEKD